mgnify:CR=1 FL=1
MKDRVGTQVLANGARRYANYNASGQLQGYMYLLLADEPSEAGTALNKANLLSDATAAAIGVTSSDPTVNEALAKLAHTTAITVPASRWSSTKPYSQTVSVSGVTEDMNPDYTLNPSATSEAAAEGFGYISTMETGNGTVTFRCNTDLPTVDLPIVLKGV